MSKFSTGSIFIRCSIFVVSQPQFTYGPIIALGWKSSTQKYPEAFYTNLINGKAEIKRSWFQLGPMQKWQNFSTSYPNHQIFPLKESTHSHHTRLHVSITVHCISSITYTFWKYVQKFWRKTFLVEDLVVTILNLIGILNSLHLSSFFPYQRFSFN
jgi:hypothetical protein